MTFGLPIEIHVFRLLCTSGNIDRFLYVFIYISRRYLVELILNHVAYIGVGALSRRTYHQASHFGSEQSRHSWSGWDLSDDNQFSEEHERFASHNSR